MPTTVWTLPETGEHDPVSRVLAAFDPTAGRALVVDLAAATSDTATSDTATSDTATSDTGSSLAAPSSPVATEPDRYSLVVVDLTGIDPAATAAGFGACAARLADQLDTAGLLAVLTRHGHRDSGELLDPTGSIVAAAHAATLDYLQHIVVLTSPLPDPAIPAISSPGDPDTPGSQSGSDAAGVTGPRVELLVFLRRDAMSTAATPVPPPGEATSSGAETRPVGSPEPALTGRILSRPTRCGSRPEDEPAPARTSAPTSARTSVGGAPATGRAGVWLAAQQTPAVQRRGRYVPESVRHPARMLPAIAAHAIAEFTDPGDLVVDPLAGIGTTLVEAVHAGRRALVVEYEPRWAQIADANRLLAAHAGHTTAEDSRVLCGDARRLDQLLDPAETGQVALVLTSPPYGKAAHGHITQNGPVTKTNFRYSDRVDRANLAHAEPDRLLLGFTRVLRGAAALLRPGGHLVVTVRPWRDHGELIDLPGQVADCARDAGLVVTDRAVALLGRIDDRGQLVAHASFFQRHNITRRRADGLPLHLIAHEDVVIARRPARPVSSA